VGHLSWFCDLGALRAYKRKKNSQNGRNGHLASNRENRRFPSVPPTEAQAPTAAQSFAVFPCVSESQHRLTQHTQHATHESKTKYTLLYAKGHITRWNI
jgi:hypothetical protein